MAERVTETRRRDWWERHKNKPCAVYVFRLDNDERIAWLVDCARVDRFWHGVRRAVIEQQAEREVLCLCCQVELTGDPAAVVILAVDVEVAPDNELLSAAVCRECCTRLEDREIVNRMAAPFNGVVLGRADQIAGNVHAAHGTKQ